ncbi:MAG: enoyl-CoA hydratase/isomerase family protein [Actinomycetota bacterium]
MSEFVKVTVDEATGVATILLDRPKMNAINDEVAAGLVEAAERCTTDDSIRAVVLTGGGKIFAAGADIKAMAEATPEQMHERIGGLQASFTAIEQIPKVVIAAVNGFALGGGCELAMCADFRVIADNAQMGQPEILLGVIPGAGGTQRLTRLVGPSRAKDIIYSGRFVGCVEAREIGLADVVVAPDQTIARATEMAAAYAKGPTRALAAAKSAIEARSSMPMAEGLAHEARLFADLFGTEDQKIGMRTFLEKGPGQAEFTGR